ncbi:hypothetical protein [Pseudomonas sp. AP3_22 TE3818]|nr:hypothetical protein [Pseudomonas reinekei]
MVVNGNACKPDKRGAFEPIAGKPAPTVFRVASFSAWARSLVGAGLPAMVVNDNAGELDKRGAPESIAGKPAPTIPQGMREEPFVFEQANFSRAPID